MSEDAENIGLFPVSLAADGRSFVRVDSGDRLVICGWRSSLGLPRMKAPPWARKHTALLHSILTAVPT